jgi:hypothetical protein
MYIITPILHVQKHQLGADSIERKGLCVDKQSMEQWGGGPAHGPGVRLRRLQEMTMLHSRAYACETCENNHETYRAQHAHGNNDCV